MSVVNSCTVVVKHINYKEKLIIVAARGENITPMVMVILNSELLVPAEPRRL